MKKNLLSLPRNSGTDGSERIIKQSVSLIFKQLHSLRVLKKEKLFCHLSLPGGRLLWLLVSTNYSFFTWHPQAPAGTWSLLSLLHLYSKQSPGAALIIVFSCFLPEGCVPARKTQQHV